MLRRELFLTLGGSREVSGHVDMGFEFGWRVLTTYPLKPVNPDDMAMRLVASQLRGWGYNAQVWADGTIRVTLPRTDSYGPVLREIARAYLLAIESPNPRRPAL